MLFFLATKTYLTKCARACQTRTSYTLISKYSPENSLNGESTILAEITILPNTKANIGELIDKAMAYLENLNVLKQREILFTKALLHEYGYPIYKMGHRGKRETIMAWSKNQKLYQRADGGAGTTGTWIKHRKKH